MLYDADALLHTKNEVCVVVADTKESTAVSDDFEEDNLLKRRTKKSLARKNRNSNLFF